MLKDDYYQAPNHQNDLFDQLGLPASNQQKQEPTLNLKVDQKEKKNKYLQDHQNSFQNEEQSKNETIAQTRYQEDKREQVNYQKEQKKSQKVVRTMRRGGKKPKQQNKKGGKKQQIQINVQTNQVAEWGEKGTKNEGENDDSFESDIAEEEMAEKTPEDESIRKKLQEKVKKMENLQDKKKQGSSLSSLKNKAEQLKRKNLQKNKQEREAEESAFDLRKNEKKEEIKEQEEDESESDEEDHWAKINQQTLQKQEKKQKISSELTLASVVHHYQSLNSQQKQKIQEQLQNQKPEPSFWDTLCSCLKPSKKAFTDVQIQIISISKMQLSKSPQQMFLLKRIWSQLTGKQFMRFGEHWNEIGFQGRDPATDLRSTGILSLIHWACFLDQHQEFGLKMSNFCTQFGIPLALTHIKVTSLVLTSLKKSLLSGKKWQDYQQWYNALAFYVFDKIQKNAKNLQEVGELVEKTVENAGKNLSLAKKNYHTEIKKK